MTHEDKLEFWNMVCAFGQWSKRLAETHREGVGLPADVNDLDEDMVCEILNEFPTHTPPEELSAQLEKWLQRFFS